MSDIDTLIAAFQTQLSDVMKTILKTAMYEVTKLVEDGLMEQLRSRNHEVESLKVQLQLAEKHLNDEYVVRKNEECDYNHGNSDLDELIEWHSDSGVAEGSGLKLGKNCLSDSMGSFRQEVMTNVGETHTAEKLTPNISPKRDTQATEEDNDRPAVVVKAEADVKPSCSIDHQEEGWSDGVCRSQFHNLNEILDLQSKQTQRSTKELSETDIGQAGHSSPITFTGDNEDLVSPLDSKPGGLSPMQNNTLNIADDSEPALLSGSTIQICNKLVGPASICIDHGNNRDQIYSKSKLQIAHVGDMVIKQEMLLDSDEDKEDKELLEKEATGSTIAFPSCPEKNYMERSHVGLNYISHKPKMQEVTKRHFKVGTSLSFQAAVRHHRPVKKTHHTLLSNTSTAHSFATSLNLHNRTPPSFKVAVPPNSAQPANLSDKRNKTESQNCLPLVNIKASYQAENSQQANLQAFPGSHSQGPRHLLRCGQCGKCFPHPSNLKAHLQIHTGERPFSCSQCGRSFTKLSNLKAHRRVHTGERPYCCLACGKRFTQKCNLKRHQRIHLDV